jgi:HD-like signal output (HDOD) protein
MTTKKQGGRSYCKEPALAPEYRLSDTHAKIGADLLKRYGEPPEVVQAASGHHEDVRLENPYTMIVMTADAYIAHGGTIDGRNGGKDLPGHCTSTYKGERFPFLGVFMRQ